MANFNNPPNGGAHGGGRGSGQHLSARPRAMPMFGLGHGGDPFGPDSLAREMRAMQDMFGGATASNDSVQPGSMLSPFFGGLGGFGGFESQLKDMEKLAGSAGSHSSYSMAYVGGTSVDENGKPQHVFEQRQAYSNSGTKEEKRSMTRGLNDQARKIVRTKRGGHPAEDHQYLHNLGHDELDSFDAKWRTHGAQLGQLGGQLGSRDALRSPHVSSQALDTSRRADFGRLGSGGFGLDTAPNTFSRHLAAGAGRGSARPTNDREDVHARLRQLESENAGLRQQLASRGRSGAH